MKHQKQPPTKKPCHECGGERVPVELSTVLQARQCASSATLLSSKSNTSYMNAFTCTACGCTTLYASEPRNLISDAY